jgi:hypothetical protein
VSHAKRTDSNQRAIVAALRQAGYSVEILSGVGEGMPDLLVGGVSRTDGDLRCWLMEVKAQRGFLNSRQRNWRAAWRGQYAVVRTIGEALAVVGVRFEDADLGSAALALVAERE